MSKSRIFVEGTSDATFIRQLIKKKFGIESVQVESTVDEDAECLFDIDPIGGNLSEPALREPIRNVINRMPKHKNVNTIAIIVDADNNIDDKRILFGQLMTELEFQCIAPDEYQHARENLTVKCFFIGIKTGDSVVGELEDILTLIRKSETTHHADCLDKWNECLNAKDKPFNAKALKKLKTYFYWRFDIFKSNQSNAKENCTFEKSFDKDGWDLEHPILEELTAFLASLV